MNLSKVFVVKNNFLKTITIQIKTMNKKDNISNNIC